MSDWNLKKLSFLNMPLDEKRKHYKCGDRFTTLSDIIDWNTYAKTDEGKADLYATKGTASTESDEGDKGGINAKDGAQSLTKNDDLNQKISIFTGDITCLEIDAIVNAANSKLSGGGGVDGAIHSAAGRSLLQAECKSLNGCDTGDVKITGGYRLPAKYVINAVGPVGENAKHLSDCYWKSMDLLKEHQLETIAFPCISTGVYGYPNGRAAKVALETIRKWLDQNEYSSNIKRVIFCLYLEVDKKIYHKLLPTYFPI